MPRIFCYISVCHPIGQKSVKALAFTGCSQASRKIELKTDRMVERVEEFPSFKKGDIIKYGNGDKHKDERVLPVYNKDTMCRKQQKQNVLGCMK
jgi:hypothetical protein